MTSRVNHLHGFTLIETVVVVALTAVILTTLSWLLVYFYKTNAYLLEQTTAVREARSGVEDVVKYVREARGDINGSYPIQIATPSSLSFAADVQGDASLEEVGYRLQDTTLYRTITIGNSVATTTLSTHILENGATPIFRYFDSTGTELTIPISLANIASIRVTLQIDVDSSRGPTAITLSSTATIRNNITP